MTQSIQRWTSEGASIRLLYAAVAAFSVILTTSCGRAQQSEPLTLKSKPITKSEPDMKTEKAILAGGCFWGMEDLFRKLPGVVSTRVGYSGGDVQNATYRHHGTHAESIEVVFDPEKTNFRNLLEFFFQVHDPTTKNRQGNDMGTSYRSAIFYTSEEQKQIALDTIKDVNASGLWPGKWLLKSNQPAIFGKPNRSIKTI